MFWEQHNGSQAKKPEEVEVTPSTVYLRRNIKESERTNEDGTKTKEWTYEEVKLSPEEYATMESIVYQDLRDRMEALDSTLAEVLLNQVEGSME